MCSDASYIQQDAVFSCKRGLNRSLLTKTHLPDHPVFVLYWYAVNSGYLGGYCMGRHGGLGGPTCYNQSRSRAWMQHGLFSGVRGNGKRCSDGALFAQVEQALKVPPESSGIGRSVPYPAGSSSIRGCLLCVPLARRIFPS